MTPWSVFWTDLAQVTICFAVGAVGFVAFFWLIDRLD